MGTLSTLQEVLRHRLGAAAHDLGAATRTDLRRIDGALGPLMERIEVLSRALIEADARTDALTGEIRDLRAQLEAVERSRTDERLAVLERVQAEQRGFNARVDDRALIADLHRWITHTPLRTEPLVSVVLPTRNRPAHLMRAIDSVLGQSYPHWELLVVDDGGEGEATPAADVHHDARIRWLRTTGGRGACAARTSRSTTSTGRSWPTSTTTT